MSALILPLLLFAIFYFVLIRPQQRKMKEQQALVRKASAGDRIMLNSGIYGTITEVVDDAAYIELADGIEILVNRNFIQELLDAFPTESASEDDDAEEDDAAEDAEDDDEWDEDDDDIQDADVHDAADEDADEVDA